MVVRPNIYPGEPRTRRSTKLRSKGGTAGSLGRVVAGSGSVPLAIHRKAVPRERTRRRAEPAVAPCQRIEVVGPSQGNGGLCRGQWPKAWHRLCI
jgi:hypothetical protein